MTRGSLVKLNVPKVVSALCIEQRLLGDLMIHHGTKNVVDCLSDTRDMYTLPINSDLQPILV